MTYLKLFKNQNRVTVVQACKTEPGGCCGYDFRFIPSSLRTWTGFPGSSAGKESTCNAGDPSSIPGSGRSPRERIGHPLQFSWASLVAQMTKNPPAMWATWVPSLGREDPWRREWQPTPVFLPGNSHGQRSLAGYTPLGLYRLVSDSRILLAVFKTGAASYTLIVSNFFPPLQLCNHFRLPVIPCLTSNLISCQLQPQSQFLMNHLCNLLGFLPL